MFVTQIDSDAYVPLAQTSITSAYANGAQATYARRLVTDAGFLALIDTDELGWDTDVFIYYLRPICVNHRSSVVCFQMGRLRLIIDCM